jgi:hypothetical protein
MKWPFVTEANMPPKSEGSPSDMAFPTKKLPNTIAMLGPIPRAAALPTGPSRCELKPGEP